MLPAYSYYILHLKSNFYNPWECIMTETLLYFINGIKILSMKYAILVC